MHKPESVLENETYEILLDFEIQSDNWISARRPDQVLSNKKKRTCHSVSFAVSVKESEKIGKYLDFASSGLWKWRWYQL